jgi:MYXO-CTERM domain-containing protein
MDIVVAALSTAGERLFQNDGTGQFTAVPGAFTAITDPTLWIDFGDLTGDGRLDAMTAQGESTPQLERVYFGNQGVAVDTLAPKILGQSATSATGADLAVRFRISDGAVTDDGPRLAGAWIEANGAIVKATFSGGDVFRAVVPASVPQGTMLRACAEDLRGNVTAGCTTMPTTTTTASSSSASSGATGSGAATTSTGSGSSGGAGGAGGGSDSGGGCGCRVEAADDAALDVVPLALLSLCAAFARRRGRASRDGDLS